MCGIAGQFNYNKKDATGYKDVYKLMQETLRRRGPDSQGIYMYENVAMIHSRLAVIDVEKGKQPWVEKYDDNEVVMVYNGELYNTSELKSDLEKRGHTFYTHSDTEVLIHAYMEYKEECLALLNGIYAFAVWEKKYNRLFIARDRIGVKPFFYVDKGDKFIYGSEIKTLLAHPEIESKIDIEGIAQIMLIGPGRIQGKGVFKDIEELKPGEYMYVFENGDISKKKYWDLYDFRHEDSFSNTVEKVRFLVEDSVKRQLVSDVDVCTFLSGGLDSSIISSIASKYMKEQGRKLKTVSVGYSNNNRYFKSSKFQPNSDDKYIEIMKQYIDSDNFITLIDTEELIQSLYEAVDARDLPGMSDVDGSLLLFCKDIKKIATVGLSGECADEIFGGYPWYRDKEIREQYGFPWAQSTDYRASFLKDNIVKKIKPREYVNYYYDKTIVETDTMKGICKNERRMREMVNLNFKWFMQTLLDRKDRMSMYNSLEVRVPFCDHRIAEYLYCIPWSYKDYKGYEKGLLREAMRGYLPKEVLWRKKSPYPKTHNPAYRDGVARVLKIIIDDNKSPLHRIVKKEKLEELLKTQRQTPWYGQLMTTPQTIAYMIQINYWLKKYNITME